MDDSSPGTGFPATPGTSSDDSAPQEPAVPIFVEVITEEPVEYVVPEPPVPGVESVKPLDDPPPTTGHPAQPGDAQSTVPHPILQDTGEAPLQENKPPIERPLGTTAPLPPKPSGNEPDC